MIFDIVRLSCRRPAPVSSVCSKLGISERALVAEIKKAGKSGYHVTIHDGFVSSFRPIGAEKTVTIGASAPGRHHVAVATDWHVGSDHCDEKGFAEFLRIAWKKGCRSAVATGDLLDGNKDVLLRDQKLVGYEHQAARAVELVKAAPAFDWVAIDGNHDGYFSASGGLTCGKLLEAEMRAAGVAWTFAGVCLGRAVVHGARWQLWHPHGGASTRNAVRRILNARAETLQERCDILAIGHFHKFVSLPIYPEGVHGIAGGTFQTKNSEFANRISNNWDVGGTIVSYTVGRRGVVSEVSAEFLPVRGGR